MKTIVSGGSVIVKLHVMKHIVSDGSDKLHVMKHIVSNGSVRTICDEKKKCVPVILIVTTAS